MVKASATAEALLFLLRRGGVLSLSKYLIRRSFLNLVDVMKSLYLFVWLVEDKPAYRQAGTNHGVFAFSLPNTCNAGKLKNNIEPFQCCFNLWFFTFVRGLAHKKISTHKTVPGRPRQTELL